MSICEGEFWLCRRSFQTTWTSNFAYPELWKNNYASVPPGGGRTGMNMSAPDRGRAGPEPRGGTKTVIGPGGWVLLLFYRPQPKAGTFRRGRAAARSLPLDARAAARMVWCKREFELFEETAGQSVRRMLQQDLTGAETDLEW